MNKKRFPQPTATHPVSPVNGIEEVVPCCDGKIAAPVTGPAWSPCMTAPLFTKGQHIDFALVKNLEEIKMSGRGTIAGMYYEVADALGKDINRWVYYCNFEMLDGVKLNYIVEEWRLLAGFKIFKV